MRCLITGGAGFIGSHLVEEALRRHYEVVILDDLSTGKRENLTDVRSYIKFTKGDIRDLDVLRYCLRGVDLVFHHAAVASVPVTVEDPFKSAEVNDLGTLNVFWSAKKAGVKRVVYASSSAVYGGNSAPPHSENIPPDPETPYAAHKLLGEHYGNIFSNLYGLEVVSLRYFNVFGPRQDPSSPYSGVISIFMDRLLKGEPPVVYGDGNQSRDFIYVDDIVRLNFLAAFNEQAVGQAYNGGTGRAVTINRMLETLSHLIDRPIKPIHQAKRPGDVYVSLADPALAWQKLEFRAQVSFEAGLAQTWAWFRTEETD